MRSTAAATSSVTCAAARRPEERVGELACRGLPGRRVTVRDETVDMQRDEELDDGSSSCRAKPRRWISSQRSSSVSPIPSASSSPWPRSWSATPRTSDRRHRRPAHPPRHGSRRRDPRMLRLRIDDRAGPASGTRLIEPLRWRRRPPRSGTQAVYAWLQGSRRRHRSPGPPRTRIEPSCHFLEDAPSRPGGGANLPHTA